MPDYEITRHAETRMSQRAIRNEDIELVLTFGTPIGSSEWFMKRADVEHEIEYLKRMFRQLERTLKGRRKQGFERALKRWIQLLERLKGLKVVVAGDTVITCYWPSAAYQRRARRRGRAA